MAGELGNAMYGLNTWEEGRHEDGDRAETSGTQVCRSLLEAEIRQIVESDSPGGQPAQNESIATAKLDRKGMSMTQIIDELSVTLRDLEIERLNKKVRRLQARCTQLRQKNDEADRVRDERDARGAARRCFSSNYSTKRQDKPRTSVPLPGGHPVTR